MDFNKQELLLLATLIGIKTNLVSRSGDDIKQVIKTNLAKRRNKASKELKIEPDENDVEIIQWLATVYGTKKVDSWDELDLADLISVLQTHIKKNYSRSGKIGSFKILEALNNDGEVKEMISEMV